MNCNEDIHNEMKESEVVCPFCDQQIDFVRKPKDDKCCNNRDIINDNGMQVCQSCGIVQGYDYVKEYVDFYENKNRFMRKSVYHREYHINNCIMNVKKKYNIEISYNETCKIGAIFVDIGKVLAQVNGIRKRMISINYIMRKIFDMMGIPCKDIPISKSKKTLTFCDKYWKHIMLLIGNKIKFIIG